MNTNGDYLYFSTVGLVDRTTNCEITPNIGLMPFNESHLFLSSLAKSSALQYSLDKFIDIEGKSVIHKGKSYVYHTAIYTLNGEQHEDYFTYSPETMQFSHENIRFNLENVFFYVEEAGIKFIRATELLKDRLHRLKFIRNAYYVNNIYSSMLEYTDGHEVKVSCRDGEFTFLIDTELEYIELYAYDSDTVKFVVDCCKELPDVHSLDEDRIEPYYTIATALGLELLSDYFTSLS